MRTSQNNLSGSLSLSSPQFSAAQLQIDSLIQTFSREALNGTALAAMTMGGLAYRLGKVAFLASSPRFARFASPLFGLSCEVSAFQGTERLLCESHLSFSEGWRNSFVDFGIMKGVGHLLRTQNLIGRHLAQDLSMVAGHQATAFLGWTPAPEGNFLDQMLHAEITNLQLGIGTHFSAHLSGHRIINLERNFDQLSLYHLSPSMYPRQQNLLFSITGTTILGITALSSGMLHSTTGIFTQLSHLSPHALTHLNTDTSLPLAMMQPSHNLAPTLLICGSLMLGGIFQSAALALRHRKQRYDFETRARQSALKREELLVQEISALLIEKEVLGSAYRQEKLRDPQVLTEAARRRTTLYLDKLSWWNPSELSEVLANNQVSAASLWLERNLKNGNTSIRVSAALALARLDSRDAIPDLIQIVRSDSNLELRRAAFLALLFFKAPEAIEFFLKFTESYSFFIGYPLTPDQRQEVEIVLRELEKASSVPYFLKAVKNKESRERAILALVRIKAPQAITLFLEESSRGNSAVNQVLAELQVPENIPHFQACLQSSEIEKYLSVIPILVKLRVTQALPELQRLLSHNNSSIRLAVIKACLDLGGDVPNILTLLSDPFSEVRIAAIEAVRFLKWDASLRMDIISKLRGYLVGQIDQKVCVAAMKTLGDLDAREAIPDIQAHLQNHYLVGASAVETLTKMQAKQFLPYYRDRMRDTRSIFDDSFRAAIISALAAFGDQTCLLEIRECLNHHYNTNIVHVAAIQALAHLKDQSPEVIERIHVFLASSAPEVRSAAELALEQLAPGWR